METRNNLRKLDIGCGRTVTAGYLRMDVNREVPDLDYVGPMTDLPFPTDFLQEIRASHVIEHVPMHIAKEVLVEFHRAIEPGGFIWLDTPNIERNVHLYHSGQWMGDFNNLLRSEQEACSLDGIPNRTLWLNFKIFSSHLQYDQHFCNYDASLLEAFCRQAGFREVQILQVDPSLIIKAIK